MDCSPVRDYNLFRKVFSSRRMDVYSSPERANGSTCNSDKQTAQVDASVTVYRDGSNPRAIVGIDISENGNVLESIVGMERIPGGPAPGVHYIQMYRGHIDENHNNQADEGEKEVVIITYPVDYGQDPSNFDTDLEPLEGIRIIEE